MKTKLIYVGLFIASTLVAAGLVFAVVPRHTGAVAKDSSAVAGHKEPSVKMDSLAAKSDNSPSPQISGEIANPDTVKPHLSEVDALRDSIAQLKATLEMEMKKAVNARPSVDTTRVDTTASQEKKAMAKLIEGMDAQGASRILHNMDDKEIKAILLLVKKRQAGKILSSLDPERAARIMR